MKKLLIVSLILFLILFTAFIKNSTKRIDDEIFSIKENIRVFVKEYESVKLENDYLGSTEKLLKFQSLYFEDELVKKPIQNIKIIKKINNSLQIQDLKIINE